MAAITFNNYSPDQVTISFNGINVTGFMDGTFIDVEHEEQAYTKHTGSLGDVTRTRNLNRTGKITITLMSGAPSNDLLQAMYQQDRQFGTGVGAFLVKDLGGNMVCRAAYAWIMKAPKIERAKESSPCVWQLEAADLSIVAGSQLR